jgi:hypothetical protein
LSCGAGTCIDHHPQPWNAKGASLSSALEGVARSRIGRAPG